MNIPHFYEDIRPVSEEEEELYKQIDPQEFDPKKYQHDLGVQKMLGDVNTTDLLMRRWRQPTFSIHNIIPSHGGSCNTVIPSAVSARVSMRLVPDQSSDAIFSSFVSFVEKKVRCLLISSSPHLLISSSPHLLHLFISLILDCNLMDGV